MAKDPAQNVGKRNLPAFPYDQNAKYPAVLVGAIVDKNTGEVIGYLPIECIDNGDGTCSPTFYVKGFSP
jgi:hypothetical protein